MSHHSIAGRERLSFSRPSLVVAVLMESLVGLLTYAIFLSSETLASLANGTNFLEVSVHLTLGPKSRSPGLIS